MEFKMNFTHDECVKFLVDRSYRVYEHKGREIRNFFGLDEEVNYKLWVAIEPFSNDTNIYKLERYHLNEKYGLENVFQREFNKSIKNFLFNVIT